MTAGQPTAHDRIAQGLKEHPAKKGMPFNILVTAVEIGGSITLFHLAQRMGATDVVSYLIGTAALQPLATIAIKSPRSGPTITNLV